VADIVSLVADMVGSDVVCGGNRCHSYKTPAQISTQLLFQKNDIEIQVNITKWRFSTNIIGLNDTKQALSYYKTQINK